MLPDIALDEAELVGQHERLAILAERLAPILAQGMKRHCEEAELHGAPPLANRSLGAIIRSEGCQRSEIICSEWGIGISNALPAHAIVRTIPPSTLNAAPLVAEASFEAA
jgi:hypothetical protein